MKSMKFLALSGSLRKASYNTAAITALKALAPSQLEITLGNISDLPLFNPDREDENIAAVELFKLSVKDCAGLIIASPEYAHGISGPLKNALDWLVSGAEFPHKPIMLINTSPRASQAQAALREVLSTMSGKVIDKASVSIHLISSQLDASDIVAKQALAKPLLAGLNELYKTVEAQITEHSS